MKLKDEIKEIWIDVSLLTILTYVVVYIFNIVFVL